MKKELLLGLGMLASGATFAQEGVAQEIDTIESNDKAKQEIVMQQDSTNQELAKTITFDDATRFMNGNTDTGEGIGIEPDPVRSDADEGDTTECNSVTVEQPSEQRIKVHGMLQVGTGVAGDAAEVCSDRGTLIAVVDMSHPKTGLGFTGIRLDDFHNDPDQPASRATVLNLHWNQKFGRFGLGVEGKYTFIDHLPQANGFSPDVVLSYTADKGRTFEGMYAHKFKDGPDSDAFRLSISKKVNDALKITGQGWYETGYDKHFYGRIIVDVNLGNGFGAQWSCISKYGKLTPTAGVIYQF